MAGVLEAAFIILSVFGGIAGTVAAAGWARAEQLRAEGANRLQSGSPVSQEAVLQEITALKQQMAEMQDTSHQFDLAFDAALNRLEGRMDRLETKSAAAGAAPLDDAVLRSSRAR